MVRPIDEELGSLSIPVPIHEIGDGRVVSFSASEEERAGLAKRFGLRELPELKVDGRLTSRADGAVLFKGDIRARVVQTCVVTLDPVENAIDEPLRLRFVPEDRIAEPAHEVLVEADEEEEIEPMTGDIVDLGPAVAEQFGVALEPYPRKPGAQLPSGSALKTGSPAEGSRRDSPFAVLKNLGSRG